MAEIYGVGKALPERIVRNQDLTQWMETTDAWIRERSGIAERRWVRGAEHGAQSNAELGRDAARAALDASGIDAQMIDAIVYATISPDTDMPGSGSVVAESLFGKRIVPVYEVRNQCAGFVYGLSIADTLIISGSARFVLVIGVEVLSTGLDLTTRGRNTAVLFGDGAGAVVVGPDRKNRPAIRSIVLASDGNYAAALGVRSPGFTQAPAIHEGDFEGEQPALFPHMDGKLVFRMASIKMPEAVRAACERASVTVEDISLIVPHQANQRILDMLGHALKCPEKIYSNIATYGNTTAASVPLALAEAVAERRIKDGDLICLVAFGAGFAWGASVIEWREG